MAIASLASSLVGLVCGIGPILGLIFGFVALNQIKNTGQQGRGMALAGIIISALSIVIGIIVAIVVIAAAPSSPPPPPRPDSGAPAAVITIAPQAIPPAVAV